MSYIDQGTRTNKPAAIAAVIAIHAGLGYVLVSGLSTVIDILDPPPPLTGTTVIDLPPSPPPKVVEEAVKPKAPVRNENVTAPDLPITIVVNEADFIVEPTFDDFADELILKPGTGAGLGGGTKPADPPAFDPVAAAPKNNPGDWVSQSDYRSSWVRKEFDGLARFKLTVSASGKVENCQITGSTGHNVLDQATCKLVQRRARFEPARNSSGKKVSGTYTNAVRWQLPE
ncbi:TonB family protein [Pontixanthobacter luteolus]|uniref:TonB family protein n=1 Tax=Pontixanthobacter luteolus TaxID=295089 RepID=UPI0023049D11|nr:TonB family protein [Pontixanthobacter luteolus]